MEEGDGELTGDITSSGSSALSRDQSSSVVSLATPSLPPFGTLSLFLNNSCSCDFVTTDVSNHLVSVISTVGL